MSKAYIQVCGIKNHGSDVEPFVSNEEADFFGVYLCNPLAEWKADFAVHANAVDYANYLASIHECEIEFKTFSNGEKK